LDIELVGVTFGYHRKPVFQDLTLTLPASAVTALVGPNGSGKSTLLNLVAGIYRPRRGTVRRADDGVAFVVQRSAASDRLPITVRETVAMGRWASRGPWRRLTRADHAVIDECLEVVGLGSIAGRPLWAVSGGERQRALVAQGLAQRAGLLLLDEPAAHLDVEARQWITAAVDAEARRGVTVLHATHDLTAAMQAENCVLLAAGQVVGDGPPADVLAPTRLADAFLSSRTQ
jgi:zinc/manganese transport system ATP-binding protein